MGNKANLYQLGLLQSTDLQYLGPKNNGRICQRLFGFQRRQLSREISEELPLPVTDAIARNGEIQTVTELNR